MTQEELFLALSQTLPYYLLWYAIVAAIASLIMFMIEDRNAGDKATGISLGQVLLCVFLGWFVAPYVTKDERLIQRGFMWLMALKVIPPRKKSNECKH